MENKQPLLKQERCIYLTRTGEKCDKENMLLREHSLEISINEIKKLTLLCTKEHIRELIVGRLFAEGLINGLEAIEEMTLSEDQTQAFVNVKVCESVPEKIFLPIAYPNEWVFNMADRLENGMPLYEKTHGIHSCFLYEKDKLIFACEDIGRHNAMDKVIGYALLRQIDLSQCAVYSSGRVPSDMMKKVIWAGIPVFVSKGIPTADAIELAKQHQITLICGARRDKMNIYADYRKKGIDALILAGGKSSRMGGKHKGSLLCGEETFVQHLVREMERISDQIWISYGNEVHAEYENCQIVQDVYKECGPMGGVHAGLCAAENEKVIIVACDMPFMCAEFFEKILDEMNEVTDVIIPVVDGRVHPLAAVYKKRILPVVETQIQSGNYRLRRILDQVHTKYIDVSGDSRMVEMLRNINNPEEYLEIIKTT